MMKLTRELTEHIAKLSGLTLSEAELSAMTRELGEVVAYMALMDEVDTAAISPMPHILPDTNVWRADECRRSSPREAMLQNAPSQQDGQIAVPRTVEGGGA